MSLVGTWYNIHKKPVGFTRISNIRTGINYLDSIKTTNLNKFFTDNFCVFITTGEFSGY